MPKFDVIYSRTYRYLAQTIEAEDKKDAKKKLLELISRGKVLALGEDTPKIEAVKIKQ